MQVYVKSLEQEGFGFIIEVEFIETPTVVYKQYYYNVGNNNSLVDAVTKDAKEIKITIELARNILTNYIGNTYTYNEEEDRLE